MASCDHPSTDSRHIVILLLGHCRSRRRLVIVPTFSRRIPIATRQIRTHVGTITTSEQSAICSRRLAPSGVPERTEIGSGRGSPERRLMGW